MAKRAPSGISSGMTNQHRAPKASGWFVNRVLRIAPG
jgi:hypothetical protein